MPRIQPSGTALDQVRCRRILRRPGRSDPSSRLSASRGRPGGGWPTGIFVASWSSSAMLRRISARKGAGRLPPISSSPMPDGVRGERSSCEALPAATCDLTRVSIRSAAALNCQRQVGDLILPVSGNAPTGRLAQTSSLRCSASSRCVRRQMTGYTPGPPPGPRCPASTEAKGAGSRRVCSGRARHRGGCRCGLMRAGARHLQKTSSRRSSPGGWGICARLLGRMAKWPCASPGCPDGRAPPFARAGTNGWLFGLGLGNARPAHGGLSGCFLHAADHGEPVSDKGGGRRVRQMHGTGPARRQVGLFQAQSCQQANTYPTAHGEGCGAGFGILLDGGADAGPRARRWSGPTPPAPGRARPP